MTNKRAIIANYKNGNYAVRLYEDGTKIKYSQGDEFCADFPDSIDLKITDFCDLACPMCHENSTPQGGHANLNNAFLSTLRRGTELAIGGGNPMSHPQLTEFLTNMQRQGVVCNLTVNERHFLQFTSQLTELLEKKLIWGLGISLNVYDEQTFEFAKRHETVVLHAICGIIDELRARKLYNKNLKILLLGYKDCGRGVNYHTQTIDDNIAWLKANVIRFADKFATVCFDNLAITQLDLQNQIPQDIFDNCFMGNDGSASMYVDLVNLQYAASSTSTTRYPLTDTVDEAFRHVKG